MRAIKLNGRSSFAVFCVLVSFIIPVTALAVDCPCFTEEDVMTYASEPANLVCNVRGIHQGAMRILVVGQYSAGFAAFGDDTNQGDYDCSAKAEFGFRINNPKAPHIVFLETQHEDFSWAELHACWDLIELGDPPDCPCFEDCD